MMKACKCGSYAINHNCHGRDGSDDDLCDVCYWRKRAEQPAQQEQEPICKLFGTLPVYDRAAQQALDKMAENAREMGLDYEPVWGSGPTNKDYEDAMRQKRLHQLTSPQPAQRTWVGLEPGEISKIATSDPLAWANLNTVENRQYFARAIEAKLKEKNT